MRMHPQTKNDDCPENPKLHLWHCGVSPSPNTTTSHYKGVPRIKACAPTPVAWRNPPTSSRFTISFPGGLPLYDAAHWTTVPVHRSSSNPPSNCQRKTIKIAAAMMTAPITMAVALFMFRLVSFPCAASRGAWRCSPLCALASSFVISFKGFVSYSLVRTSKGGFSVTVCKDKAGTDDSTRAARDWITKNARDTGAAKPTISEGSVILHLNPQPLPP